MMRQVVTQSSSVNPSPFGRGCRQAGEGAISARGGSFARDIIVALRACPRPNSSPEGKEASLGQALAHG